MKRIHFWGKKHPFLSALFGHNGHPDVPLKVVISTWNFAPWLKLNVHILTLYEGENCRIACPMCQELGWSLNGLTGHPITFLLHHIPHNIQTILKRYLNGLTDHQLIFVPYSNIYPQPKSGLLVVLLWDNPKNISIFKQYLNRLTGHLITVLTYHIDVTHTRSWFRTFTVPRKKTSATQVWQRKRVQRNWDVEFIARDRRETGEIASLANGDFSLKARLMMMKYHQRWEVK